MMSGIMSFASAVALLLGIAALALERAASLCRLPRRGIWAAALLASCILPLAMLAHADRATETTAISMAPAAGPVHRVTSEVRGTQGVAALASASHWPTQARFDRALAAAWSAGSFALLLIWGAAALRLHRRAKTWPVLRVDEVDVFVSDDLGPAVFGYFRPRIVVPKPILTQPAAVRALALQHERAHIDSCDPALFLLGMFLVFLAPWNITLWWQLRRLRFAIEVDCDARVLRRGVKPAAYGSALLAISQRAPALRGAMAMTGPSSQLEKRVRIMMTETVRWRKLLIGASLVVAASLVLAATGMSAPSASTALAKPPPAIGAGGLAERLAILVKDRYPSLLTAKVDGTPVVYALFNDDGTVAGTNLQVFHGRASNYKVSNALFSRLGLTADAIDFVGRQGIRTRANTILVIYTQRASQYGGSSSVFADSRAIDRALAERYFPTAVEHGVSADERLWILFDHDGTVLRTGRGSIGPSSIEPSKLGSSAESVGERRLG